MNFSQAMIVIPGFCYFCVAVNEAIRGNLAMSCVYCGYCFANAGLYAIAK